MKKRQEQAFDELFDDAAEELAGRILGIADAVARGVWPEERSARIEMMRDVQRLCVATGRQVGRLIAEIERHQAWNSGT